MTQKSGGTSMQAQGRYTPPVPKEYKVSPTWVPVLMFTLLGVGMLMIVTNYMGILPGGANNWYLLVGLGLITGGFITATRYH
ncbi:MAG TPA: cell division protein CrgA [Acidimicrobiales bacterium]|nr:cell division protein CrgA [Acidimicrobiales bacterium]